MDVPKINSNSEGEFMQGAQQMHWKILFPTRIFDVQGGYFERLVAWGNQSLDFDFYTIACDAADLANLRKRSWSSLSRLKC